MWVHLTGFFFLFFSQGLVFVPAQFLGLSFSAARDGLALVYLLISLAGVIFCHKDINEDINKIKSYKKGTGEIYGRYISLIICLFVGLIWVIMVYAGGGRNDAVTETAAVTVLTDSMNKYHPFTHELLEVGMIFSKKLITLPFWYAALSQWTGFSVISTVQILGSSICLLFSLMAFAGLGRILFEKDFFRISLLIVFMEFLYLSGDYYMGSEAYRQLYYGYSGEMIVASVVIPVIITVLYRFMGRVLRNDFSIEKEGISLPGAILMISMGGGMALFLTSFVWGVLPVIIVIFLFVLSAMGSKIMRSRKEK